MDYAQPTIKEVKKWVKALRSGKYTQARGRLQREEGFCCLGVACKIFHPEYQKNEGLLYGGTPKINYGASRWLASINSDLKQKLGVGFVDLNDDKQYSYNFNEIADVIELVYIHEALKEEVPTPEITES